MKPYYQDEWVTLYHGDCLEVTDWLAADVLVTDPPYGLGGLMARSHQGAWGRLWPSGEIGIAWDHSAPRVITESVEKFSQAIVWGGNYFPLPPVRGWLIWDKVVRSFSSGHCEMAWTSIDQPIRAFNYSTGQLASEGKDHPTQKPLPLMKWCIGFTTDGACVADPFAGSGSTLVAAKALGRKAIGVELEERYCEIAARRLAQDVLDFGGGTA